MPITTCLFDMGNVLVYFSHQTMCENVAAVCDVQLAVVQDILFKSHLNNRLECGEISEQQFHQTIESELGKLCDFDALMHAVGDIFRLNESIVPLLDEIKTLRIRLVLLSNTSLTHLRFIQQNFDVLDRFDAFTTSYEAKALKPDPAIYEDALRKANCPPHDCFYTDDIEDYVLGARGFGIHAEVYTDTSSTRAALQRLGVAVSS
jgi:HAD superfamily hydrolase (TIGR01509 family)